MLKYVDHIIGFREIPDEISLCINTSSCPFRCEGCHSPELRNDIGIPLTWPALDKLIIESDGITCVCLMGGDANPIYIKALLVQIRISYPNLKIAWYSGKSNNIDDYIDFLKYLDYIKIGPYIQELGPLDDPNTNQKLYKIYHPDSGEIFEDITYLFWREITAPKKL